MTDGGTATPDAVVLGLDAACTDVLETVFAAGAAPNLAALFEAGAAGPLESQLPPWTPSAWPSMYTGVNPGKHGVYGFLRFDGYDWEIVNRTHVDAHAIWELLDHHGLSSVVVNVPVTHPPRSFDGALVPGYVAPEDPACHPEGLLADVREAVGDYRVYGRTDGDTDREARLREYEALASMRGAAFDYLLDRFEPDFGFLQFQVTDTVFHELPDDREAVCRVYAAVDEQVGRLLDDREPGAVFVVSDHGIGPYAGHEFRVNEYLRRQGYVETERGGRGMPSWGAVADGGLRGEDSDSHPLEWLVSILSKAGVTSQRVEAVTDRLGLTERVLRAVPSGAVRAASERVDFERSTAFMRSRIELGVRLNLAGREPAGVVDEEDYDAVRAKLRSLLSAVRTPEGEPVFESVLPREEVFDGPHLDGAPDLVVVPAAFDQYLSASLRSAAFGPPSEPYNHKLDGVFAVAGPAVGSGDLSGARLFDVAPTVLASLDVPAPERMDGRVLPVVSPVGRRVYPEFETDATRTTDNGRVERRLADLGYLEGDP